jgi:hypothetical protein
MGLRLGIRLGSGKTSKHAKLGFTCQRCRGYIAVRSGFQSELQYERLLNGCSHFNWSNE